MNPHRWSIAWQLALVAVSTLAPPALRAGEPAAEAPEVDAASDVVYGQGGGVELKLDYRRLGQGGPFPGVLCIHGGGWAGGKRQDMRFLVERLAARGYVAVTPSYRLAPAHPFPAQIEDVKCAVRWMRAHAARLGLDAERIGATGISAGGHLACLLGTAAPGDGLEGQGGWEAQSSRVQAVVNIFGPTDLTTRNWSETAQGILKGFLGGPLEARPEEYRRASPVAFLTRDDPPVLTFHGTADSLVPFEQAELLHRRLAELGLPNRLVAMEGHGHGWSGADLERTIAELIAFFDRQLRGRRIERF